MISGILQVMLQKERFLIVGQNESAVQTFLWKASVTEKLHFFFLRKSNKMKLQSTFYHFVTMVFFFTLPTLKIWHEIRMVNLKRCIFFFFYGLIVS